MKNDCSSIESSNTCESVRDNRRALSKQANISSWNVSSRRYSPRSSRRLMRSKDSARILGNYNFYISKVEYKTAQYNTTVTSTQNDNIWDKLRLALEITLST